jgi:hypothetical protein
MHMTASLTKWYEEHGRHEIFAGGKRVSMDGVDHKLKLVDEHVHAAANDTLDKLGIAKNSREEKLRARDAKAAKVDPVKNAEMAKLYRKHILGEKEQEGMGFVSLGQLVNTAPAKSEAVEEKKEEVFGD